MYEKYAFYKQLFKAKQEKTVKRGKYNNQICEQLRIYRETSADRCEEAVNFMWNELIP